jgi:hypothetical protein
MATSFPTGLDALTNPTGSSSLTSPDHAGQHADINDAVEALEAKVGVNGSAVTSSLDYKITNINASNLTSGTVPTGRMSGSYAGITNVGTLGSLTVTGDVTVDTNTLKVSSTNNRVGIANASPSQTLDVNGVAKATQFLQGTDYLSPYQGFRNKVINGNFGVWQRGTSVAINTLGYTADRWFHQSYNGATISRQPTSDTSVLPNVQYCARVQRNSGATSTNFMFFTQSMETQESIKVSGKTVTLSFYARKGANFPSGASAFEASLRYGTGTDQNLISGYTGGAVAFSTTVTLTSSWVRYSVTGTIPVTSTEITPLFGYTPTGTAGANDYFEITGVQLEEGSVATPFEQRPMQTELALCQRYYEKSYLLGTAPGSVSAAGTFSSVAGTNMFGFAEATIRFAVPKRTSSYTVSFWHYNTGAASTWVYQRSGVDTTGTPAADLASEFSFRAAISTGVAYTVAAMLGHWAVSAEL